MAGFRFAGPALISLAAFPAAGQDRIPVPSGQEIELLDTVQNVPGPGGLTMRFRFLAPALGQGLDVDVALADMEALCETYALPRMPDMGPRPEQIVISLSERPVAFGDADPDTVQLFEAYRAEGGTCVPEAF